MKVADVIVLAKLKLNQWLSAQDKNCNTSIGLLTQEDGNVHQNVPQINMIKINADAVIFGTSQCYSYSMVAKNHKGELSEAFSRCVQGSSNPEMA